MICYLVRHGQDDDSVRGGWSASALTDTGITQVTRLAHNILLNDKLGVGKIYTSDLLRARQTADILSAALDLPVTVMPEFRETNNGVLAGMENSVAAERYPGLYWSALTWEQSYPGGESPRQFYTRIVNAWQSFKQTIRHEEHNIILITHGGVINVIQCIENGVPYSNKSNPYPIDHAGIVGIEI